MKAIGRWVANWLKKKQNKVELMACLERFLWDRIILK